MNRKDLLTNTGVALAAALSASGRGLASANDVPVATVPNLGKPIAPPAGSVPRVAIVIAPDTVSIDVVGPWQVFHNSISQAGPLFSLCTVAKTLQPIRADGLLIAPQYTFENAPQPQVVVVPEQRVLPSTIEWIRRVSSQTDIIMSVCTGAFLLAQTGLLDGLSATTHHNGYDAFEQQFPKIKLVRGPRYVENAEVATSGGESSGIQLALRVVERYYGSDVAKRAAYNLEFVSTPRPQSVNDV